MKAVAKSDEGMLSLLENEECRIGGRRLLLLLSLLLLFSRMMMLLLWDGRFCRTRFQYGECLASA